MPQLFSFEAYFGSKIRLQALSGIGIAPSAAFTFGTLMPTVT